MIFHGYFRSSSAYRCRIAFNLKGITPEFRAVHLRRNGGEQKTDAYRTLNPQALVPALESYNGAMLTQSLAIVEWLDETIPGAPLLPVDPLIRARARAFALAIACDVHPLQNLRVLNDLKTWFGAGQATLDSWCRRWISEGLAACEVLLARELQHAFAFGDAPGIAEICLVPQMFSADRFGVDTSAWPRLQALRAACEALPAFADAHPARQPDAEA